MSRSQSYFLVSLPTSISSSNQKEEAFQALQAAVQPDHGTTYQFSIPGFKIGTLDALVQQADDLSKLDSACEGVVNKVGDSLRGLLEGDEEKIAQQKTINDSTISIDLDGKCLDRLIILRRTNRPILAIILMEPSKVSGRQATCGSDRCSTKGSPCSRDSQDWH